MANDTAGQEKQGNYITQKAIILSFQGPLRCLPSRALLRRVDGLGNYRSKACSIASCSNLNNSSSLFQFNPQTVGSESTNLTSKGVAVTKPTVLTYPVYNLAAVKLVKTDAICESVVSWHWFIDWKVDILLLLSVLLLKTGLRENFSVQTFVWKRIHRSDSVCFFTNFVLCLSAFFLFLYVPWVSSSEWWVY